MRVPCKILAVIIVYKEYYAESAAYKTLLETYCHCNDENPGSTELALMIYDNSPQPVEIKEVAPEIINIIYVHDSSNPGVSKGYNAAFKKLLEIGFDWLLLLDQDTHLALESLRVYSDSIAGNPEIMIHAPILKVQNLIISPSRYKYRRGFAIGDITPGVKELGHIVPLNSGMCVGKSVYLQTGGFNEKIKLDFSDFDFMRRAGKFNSHFAVLPLSFSHSLSSIDETYNSAIVRYKYYCLGAYYSRLSILDSAILSSVSLARGIKLSLKYNKLTFLVTFLSISFSKQKRIEI